MYTLEQARARMWRVVPLPRRLQKVDLHVFRSAATTTAAVTVAVTPHASSHSAISHVSRIPEPVVLVAQFLDLERALLHSHPVLVARALAHVDRRVPAPAVAERLTGLPVARRAGVHGWCGDGIGKRTGEGVELAKGGRLGGRVVRTRIVTILWDKPGL